MEQSASPIQLHAKLTRHMSAMSAMSAPGKAGEHQFDIAGYLPIVCAL